MGAEARTGDDAVLETGDGHGTGTGISGAWWNGRKSGTPLVVAGEGAAGISARLWEDTRLGAETETELFAGRRPGGGAETGNDALVGQTVDSGAGAGEEVGVTAGAAAGSGELGCPITEGETGTKVGSWAGRS